MKNTIINKDGLFVVAKGLRIGERSKWSQAVRDYCLDLIETLPDDWEYSNDDLFHKELLNGASNWKEYSWGGCSLIYNQDICERTATESEKKRTNNGERKPNSREQWLDVQARALFQAELRLLKIITAYND
jgi:hypothetical protein